MFRKHWLKLTKLIEAEWCIYIYVSKLGHHCSDNGLSPGRRQAIIWNNAGILLIGTLGATFNDFFIAILTFSFKKIHLKVSSGKWRPSCLDLNGLTVAQWSLLGLLSWYPLILVTSLQLIWKWGTRRWNLRVPDFQMSCCDLTHCIVAPRMATRATHLNSFVGLQINLEHFRQEQKKTKLVAL